MYASLKHGQEESHVYEQIKGRPHRGIEVDYADIETYNLEEEFAGYQRIRLESQNLRSVLKKPDRPSTSGTTRKSKDAKSKEEPKKIPKKGENAKRLEKHFVNICANSAVPIKITDEDRWRKAISHAHECTKVLVCGPQGSGKSALVNVIIGNNVAESKRDFAATSVTKDIHLYFLELKGGPRFLVFDTPPFDQSVVDFLRQSPFDVEVVIFTVDHSRTNEKETQDCFEMLGSLVSENLFQRLIIFVDCPGKIKHDPEKKHEFRETVIPSFLRDQDTMFVDLKSKWSSHSNEKWRRRLMPKLIHYDNNYAEIDEDDEPRRILGHKCPIQ